MLKCSSERWVCAPHSLSAGTSTTPRLSISCLIVAILTSPLYAGQLSRLPAISGTVKHTTFAFAIFARTCANLSPVGGKSHFFGGVLPSMIQFNRRLNYQPLLQTNPSHPASAPHMLVARAGHL